MSLSDPCASQPAHPKNPQNPNDPNDNFNKAKKRCADACTAFEPMSGDSEHSTCPGATYGDCRNNGKHRACMVLIPKESVFGKDYMEPMKLSSCAKKLIERKTKEEKRKEKDKKRADEEAAKKQKEEEKKAKEWKKKFGDKCLCSAHNQPKIDVYLFAGCPKCYCLSCVNARVRQWQQQNPQQLRSFSRSSSWNWYGYVRSLSGTWRAPAASNSWRAPNSSWGATAPTNSWGATTQNNPRGVPARINSRKTPANLAKTPNYPSKPPANSSKPPANSSKTPANSSKPQPVKANSNKQNGAYKYYYNNNIVDDHPPLNLPVRSAGGGF